MWRLILLSIMYCVQAADQSSSRSGLACAGNPHYNVSLTAYFPDFNSEDVTDYSDRRGKKLRTLQDYIDGRAEFVTVSMDKNLKLKYGSVVCVPELNEHFGRKILLQVRDSGLNLKGKGYSRLDVCVRSETDSYDAAVNRLVTVYSEN